jgi:hypothetical protein
MSLKTYLLGRMNRAFARDDLPPHDDAAHTVGDAGAAVAEAPPHRLRAAPSLDHLGAYRPLVGAIREELERFVASDLRLHLAIAERDRYVLTAIEIECLGHEERPGLLARFIREFAPEQVKQYLAREIIARLPNASAIDLTQFAGLEAAADKDADHAYDDLIAELRSDEPATARPYSVTLVGRWSEAAAQRLAPGRALATPPTPLAGQKVSFEIEDAGGVRSVELAGVVPGRRYAVGKDPACDIVVDGTYASRRHCELWLDQGTWWVADCGSTNGVRVDPASVLDRGALLTSHGGDGKVLAVAPGAHVVLSAVSRGEPGQYPRLRVQAREGAARAALLHTPVTPIVPPRSSAGGGLALTVQMATGVRTIELPRGALPFGVGRSRSQALVVDWAHEGVSGHHVDLTEAGEDRVQVSVHGDNGVSVAGVTHGAGARFEWKVGETMVLGRAVNDEPPCSLTLARAP